jgi:tagatose 1,6-diphosphate aldolase GatY/KbaY
MLIEASLGGYGVCAFNVENMEMVIAAIEKAEAMRAPVIIQTTPGTLRHAGPEIFAAMVKSLADGVRVPVALHLDHGDSFELAVRVLRAGYTSVMIDGSRLDFAENVRLTKSVVRVCRACGIPVEGELGAIGGKEDDLSGLSGDGLTDPGEAAAFAGETGVDSLAVAVGTAHGFYKKEPKLDLARLAAIRDKAKIPLVLHGASGVPFDAVRAAVKNGVTKVNYATDLRVIFTQAVKDSLARDPKTTDPKKYLKVAMEAVKNRAESRIANCGGAGRIPPENVKPNVGVDI